MGKDQVESEGKRKETKAYGRQLVKLLNENSLVIVTGIERGSRKRFYVAQHTFITMGGENIHLEDLINVLDFDCDQSKLK